LRSGVRASFPAPEISLVVKDFEAEAEAEADHDHDHDHDSDQSPRYADALQTTQFPERGQGTANQGSEPFLPAS
jgi:hypothetical protein